MWIPEKNWPEEGRDYRRALAWASCQTKFFDRHRPLTVTRAPGRLDVMGGIADYSGALVLEMPIAAATWVAAQASDDPEVVIESDGHPRVRRRSRRCGFRSPSSSPSEPLTYERARALLTGDPRRAWAAYAAGALVVLHAELGKPLRHGVRLMVWSEVPVGKGLSSSAALEVATLEAVAPLVGATLDDRDVALLAQKVENFVVGAPCGVMDQMTSALGRRDHLLELVCQPAEVIGQLRVPDDIEFVGVDSGIRHAVSGADYGTVRAAAFMGYRMIAAAAGVDARPLSPGRVAIDDALFKGYLANVPAADWRARYRAEIPEQMSGADFLARFQGTTDKATDDRSGAPLSRAGRDRARDRGAPARPRVSRAADGQAERGRKVARAARRADVRVARELLGVWPWLRRNRQAGRAGARGGAERRALRREDHRRRQRWYGRGADRARNAAQRCQARRSLRTRVGSRVGRCTRARPMDRGHSACAG